MRHFTSTLVVALHMCLLCVQLITCMWRHANTCSVEIRRGAHTEFALIFVCDITTKVLVKCRIDYIIFLTIPDWLNTR